MIQVKIVGFNLIKLFVKHFVLELKETVRQVMSNFVCSNVSCDILNSATAVGNRLTFLS